jgi:hypothetical protein
MNELLDPQQVTVDSTNSLTTPAADGAAKAAWLFNTFAAGIHAGGTGIQAAALQVAIWEAIYDGTANPPVEPSGWSRAPACTADRRRHSRS